MLIIQFSIPRAAAEALPIEGILPGAQAAGVPNTRLEYTTAADHVAATQITCSIEMAKYLVEQLTELAQRLEGKGRTPTLIACCYAAKAALDAMERGIYGPGGNPTSGRRTSRALRKSCATR